MACGAFRLKTTENRCAIEPYDLAALRLDSRLALLYCERVARPTDSSKKTQREANYRDLVEYFPAHEFAIDIAEAGDGLKFNVSEPEGEIEGIFDALRPERDIVNCCGSGF